MVSVSQWLYSHLPSDADLGVTPKDLKDAARDLQRFAKQSGGVATLGFKALDAVFEFGRNTFTPLEQTSQDLDLLARQSNSTLAKLGYSSVGLLFSPASKAYRLPHDLATGSVDFFADPITAVTSMPEAVHQNGNAIQNGALVMADGNVSTGLSQLLDGVIGDAMIVAVALGMVKMAGKTASAVADLRIKLPKMSADDAAFNRWMANPQRGTMDIRPIVDLIQKLRGGDKNAQVLAKFADKITSGADAAARSSAIRDLVDMNDQVKFTSDAQLVTNLKLDFHGIREILLDRAVNAPDASARLAAVEGLQVYTQGLMKCYKKLNDGHMDNTNPGNLKLQAEVAATLHDMRNVMQSIAESDLDGAVKIAASRVATDANKGYMKILRSLYDTASFMETNRRAVYPSNLPQVFLKLLDGSPEVIAMIDRGTEYTTLYIQRSVAAMTRDPKQPMLGRVVDVNERGEVGSSYQWKDDGGNQSGYGRNDDVPPPPTPAHLMSDVQWNQTQFKPTRPQPAVADMSDAEYDYYKSKK